GFRGDLGAVGESDEGTDIFEALADFADERVLLEAPLEPVQLLLEIVEQQDRKSTRLNSSHRTISYAVFCLKKKKKKNIINPNVRIQTRDYNINGLNESY